MVAFFFYGAALALPLAAVLAALPLPFLTENLLVKNLLLTFLIGLALVVRIREDYGTIEEDEIVDAEQAIAAKEYEDQEPWLV